MYLNWIWERYTWKEKEADRGGQLVGRINLAPRANSTIPHYTWISLRRNVLIILLHETNK